MKQTRQELVKRRKYVKARKVLEDFVRMFRRRCARGDHVVDGRSTSLRLLLTAARRIDPGEDQEVDHAEIFSWAALP